MHAPLGAADSGVEPVVGARWRGRLPSRCMSRKPAGRLPACHRHLDCVGSRRHAGAADRYAGAVCKRGLQPWSFRWRMPTTSAGLLPWSTGGPQPASPSNIEAMRFGAAGARQPTQGDPRRDRPRRWLLVPAARRQTALAGARRPAAGVQEMNGALGRRIGLVAGQLRLEPRLRNVAVGGAGDPCGRRGPRRGCSTDDGGLASTRWPREAALELAKSRGSRRAAKGSASVTLARPRSGRRCRRRPGGPGAACRAS